MESCSKGATSVLLNRYNKEIVQLLTGNGNKQNIEKNSRNLISVSSPVPTLKSSGNVTGRTFTGLWVDFSSL